MGIDFNNVRIQAANNFNRLCAKLNDAIKDQSFDPEIIISPEMIQKEMDELRMCIVSICHSYEPGDDGFKDVGEEIKVFEEFNPEKCV